MTTKDRSKSGLLYFLKVMYTYFGRGMHLRKGKDSTMRLFGLAAILLAGCGPATSSGDGNPPSQTVPANVHGPAPSPTLREVGETEALKKAAGCLDLPPFLIPMLGELSHKDDLPLQLGMDRHEVLALLRTFKVTEVTVDRYGLCGKSVPADRHPDMRLPHTGLIKRNEQEVPTELFVIVLTKTSPDGARTFVSIFGPLDANRFPKSQPAPLVA